MFTKLLKDGVELEVRKGYGERGYASARIKLSRLPKRNLPEVMLMLNEIADQTEMKR